MICKNCGAALADGVKFCSKCGTAAAAEAAAPVEAPVDAAVEVPVNAPVEVAAEVPAPHEAGGKKGGKGIWKVLVAAVLVLALAAAAVFVLPGLFGPNVMCVYMTEDGELMYLDKFNGKGEAEELTDEPVYEVWFSDDGKYVYFVEEDSQTLYSMKVSDIGRKGAKAEKLDKYVYSVIFTASGDVLYSNGDSELMLYDGKDTHKLCKDVMTWNYLKDENTIYYQQQKDGGVNLYRMEPKVDAEEERLVKAATEIRIFNKDLVVYLQREDDGTYTVCSAVPGEKAEKVKSGLTEYPAGVIVKDGKVVVYYYGYEKVDYVLYDFVTDAYAEQDARITKPSKSDYQKYVESYWGGGYWTTDYDAYNAAYYIWEEKNNRDYIRSDLQNYPFTMSYRMLYRYADGKESVVAGDLNVTQCIDYYNDFYVYSKIDREIGTFCDVADLYYAGEVEYYLYNENYSKELYLSVNGKESLIKGVELTDVYSGASAYRLSDSEFALRTSNSEGYDDLWICRVENGAVTDAKIEQKNVRGLSFGTYNDAQALFFYDDVVGSGSGSEGTLLCYQNGETVEIAEDAGVVCMSSDFEKTIVGRDYDDGTFTYCILEGEDEIEIGDEIEEFSLLENSDVVYISDGDLYYFNGKDSKRIAKGVEDYVLNREVEMSYRNCY